ncbi:MAG: cytidylate kinase family protein [Hyphomicrobium sp.]|nr:cytidylate kinase family protein [Hyphomicrobium sp.]
MTVIAMTREIGARGSDVAAGLAERLGLEIVHHELVEHDIAERTGLSEDEVHRHLEGEAFLIERITLDKRRLSRYTAQEILELAAKDNVLIRGWGATYLLRMIPHVVCVRICAPIAYRERTLIERLSLSGPVAAQREIAHSDAAHNGMMQRLFGVDWQDPTLYAAVLNTARIPVCECIELIARLTKSIAFRDTPQSRQVLSDQLVRERVRVALDRRFGSSALHSGMDAHVRDGSVLLIGATTDEQLIVEAVRCAQGIEGVTAVESQIRHIAFVPHDS